MKKNKKNDLPAYLKNSVKSSGADANKLSKPYKNRHEKPAIRFVVDEDGYLRDFLQKKLQGKSFNKIKSILYHNQVMVNGVITSKYDYPVKAGQNVTIKSHGAKNTIGSENLNIIYEDNEIVAINKPAGLFTMGSEKEKERTAYHFLSEFLSERDNLDDIYVVNCLDRETSGIVLFAKIESLKMKFQEEWDNLVVLMEYTAIVQGHPKDKKGTVKSFLKETSTHMVYSCKEDEGGKSAVTNYEVLKENAEYSLLRITPQTRRRNQIRVHMKDINTPIAGDKKYGGKSFALKRLGLHAGKLIVRHPVTGKKLSFEAKAGKGFTGFVK